MRLGAGRRLQVDRASVPRDHAVGSHAERGTPCIASRACSRGHPGVGLSSARPINDLPRRPGHVRSGASTSRCVRMVCSVTCVGSPRLPWIFHEEDLPTQSSPKKASSRFPCAHAHSCRASDDQEPSRQGPKAARRLSALSRKSCTEPRRPSTSLETSSALTHRTGVSALCGLPRNFDDPPRSARTDNSTHLRIPPKRTGLS